MFVYSTIHKLAAIFWAALYLIKHSNMNSLFRIGSILSCTLILCFPLSSCTSSDSEKVSEADRLCNEYSYYYDNLVQYVNTKHPGDFYDFSDERAIEEIKEKISALDIINCSHKKDLSFAYNMIDRINKTLNDRKAKYQTEIQNGDDIGMQGVKLSSPEISFDEYMNSSAKITLTNNTTKKIISLKLLVDYCSTESQSEFCYKLLIIPTTIGTMSSKSLSFSLPSTLNKQTEYPTIKLLEIVRSDGSKVKTFDGIRFGANRNY